MPRTVPTPSAPAPSTKRVVFNFDGETCQLLARRASGPHEEAAYIARLLNEDDQRHQSQPAPLARKVYRGRSRFKEVRSLVLPMEAVQILARRAPGTSDWARFVSRLIHVEEVRQEMRPEKGA
jgi:hypothetical protein